MKRTDGVNLSFSYGFSLPAADGWLFLACGVTEEGKDGRRGHEARGHDDGWTRWLIIS